MSDIVARLRAELDLLAPTPSPEELTAELAALEDRYQRMKAADHADLERRMRAVLSQGRMREVGRVRTR